MRMEMNIFIFLKNCLNDFEEILKMKRPRQKKKNIYIYTPTNSINSIN